jgi:antitoxin component of MazEF toxin-antitoxin module
MVKSITKIGNSQGVIFDAALMDLAHLKVGDEVNISVHEGGSVILTPVRHKTPAEEFTSIVRETSKRYGKTLGRLA